MSFSLVRFPEKEYETEEEAIQANFDNDATFDTDATIKETLPDGSFQMVSVNMLRNRIAEKAEKEKAVEAEIAKELDEPSTPAVPVLEATQVVSDEGELVA